MTTPPARRPSPGGRHALPEPPATPVEIPVPPHRSRARRAFERRWRRLRRRRGLLITAAVLLVFLVALLVWTAGGTGGGHAPGPTAAAPGAGTGPGGTGGTPSGSPSASGTPGATSGTGLPALPGFGPVKPGTTDLTSLGPGQHRVVVTVRSDRPLLVVSYAVKGETRGTIVYNVKSPVVITRTLTGGRPYAAVAFQMGPDSRSGSCSVSIDGKVYDSRSDDKGYAVIGCVA